nr:MAG TPA: hypothetical protein [Caudoviricetes sp.]
MAKDDYNVIVFKILTYLYAVLKRETVFDISKFKLATRLALLLIKGIILLK